MSENLITIHASVYIYTNETPFFFFFANFFHYYLLLLIYLHICDRIVTDYAPLTVYTHTVYTQTEYRIVYSTINAYLITQSMCVNIRYLINREIFFFYKCIFILHITKMNRVFHMFRYFYYFLQ